MNHNTGLTLLQPNFRTEENHLLTDLTISLLVITAGFLGMLALLVLGFENTTAELEPESNLTALDELQQPLIAMPDHLRTADEMVAWMTSDMPKLLSELQKLLRS